MKRFLLLLWRILLSVGPGIFCVGYTIGTGSVTSMIVAGSKYGMTLLWVVALSGIFSGVLMEAYGRFALVTGRTAISAFKTELSRPFALTVLIMVIAGQWCCLSGLVGLSSNAIYEGARLFAPTFVSGGAHYWAGIGIAVAVLGGLYTLFWFGNYARLEKVLVVLVTMLGVSFLISLFLIAPPIRQVGEGLVPTIPKVPGAAMLVAAMVGTSFAAPTFVVRPLLLLSKGWTAADLGKQHRDVLISALLMFIISGSILCCAAGVIYNKGGEPVEKVLDMVETLRPVGGSFAATLFLIGLVSAGLSSILPIAMIAGYLLGDYRDGSLEVRMPVFRALTAAACFLGLTVPILGANPVAAQIATQISQVFVLPLVIGGIAILVNRKSLMGKERAGILLNLGLAASMFFALMISWKALSGLIAMFAG